MSAVLWVVVLSSTLAWAVFDVLRKRLAGKIPTIELAVWLSLVQVPFYAGWWLVELGPTFPANLLTFGYLWPALASVVCNVAANLLFLSAVASADLGATIPLLSLTPVFVAIGSIPLLGERLAVRNWLGILLVTAGAMFLPEVPGDRPTLRARLAALVGAKSTLFMIATAALWAMTPVLDKLALTQVAVPSHGAFLAIGVGLATWLVLGACSVPARALGRSDVPLLLLAGAVNVVALGLQFVAISSLVVSAFEAFKRAVGLLLALLMGALVFRERPKPARLLAGVVMAVGVVLVLLPGR